MGVWRHPFCQGRLVSWLLAAAARMHVLLGSKLGPVAVVDGGFWDCLSDPTVCRHGQGTVRWLLFFYRAVHWYLGTE